MKQTRYSEPVLDFYRKSSLIATLTLTACANIPQIDFTPKNNIENKTNTVVNNEIKLPETSPQVVSANALFNAQTSANPLKVTDIRTALQEVTLAEGEQKLLIAEVILSDGSKTKEVDWLSDNTNKVSVSGTGIAQRLSPGEVTITVISRLDNSFSREIKILDEVAFTTPSPPIPVPTSPSFPTPEPLPSAVIAPPVHPLPAPSISPTVSQATPTPASSLPITTPTPEIINLALNKPVSAAESNSDFPADNLVDGRIQASNPEGEKESYWNKGGVLNGNDWIYIDLQQEELIGRVKVMPETSSSISVLWDIEISIDANNWQKIGSGTAKIAKWGETTFSPIIARFVRITPVNWGESWVAIREVEVYKQ